MRYHFAKKLPLFLSLAIGCLVLGCSNSEGVDQEIIANWNIAEDDATPLSAELDYLPLDDSEYPYAGIPRIVIETENRREIRDRETEIPAKLQIWGENSPESEVMDLTIRGRGNSSWAMPKKSYKIEFINKQTMLGMPKDRDWALIANYLDKTLMKNYLAYHLSAELGAFYAPRCDFVELFINREYLGIYLLTETIKIAKDRINIPKDSNSFLVEFDLRTRENEQKILTHTIISSGKGYQIHFPKDASSQTLQLAQNHIEAFESFLKNIQKNKNNNLAQWIDTDEYINHYWIQEFSKNPDARFNMSVFFSWIENQPIRMGPVWDFDLAMGGFNDTSINAVKDWLIKDSYWNKYVFQDSIMNHDKAAFWEANKNKFFSTISTIDSIQVLLQNAAKNNFKRWNILESTAHPCHFNSYKTYKEATDDLKNWMQNRFTWIDNHFN